jgi:hypothetical protein
MLSTIVNILVIIVLVLYIARKWSEAKQKRDFAWATRFAAGISVNEKKPSAFPYLFK